MGITCTELAIDGLLLIKPDRFSDERGYFSEVYNANALAEVGIDDQFVQDNCSLSREVGTVRGLHFQVAPFVQAKLVRVMKGAIYDVAVDLRQGSPTYGQHVGVELTAENWQQLYVPAGFAHGFCTITPDTEISYKVSNYYSREAEQGLMWNDPDLNIEWPTGAGTQVSKKDQELTAFRSFVSPFTN